MAKKYGGVPISMVKEVCSDHGIIMTTHECNGTYLKMKGWKKTEHGKDDFVYIHQRGTLTQWIIETTGIGCTVADGRRYVKQFNSALTVCTYLNRLVRQQIQTP